MERRRLGKTDMDVSVLGFGGAEIGYQGATRETVEKLLGSALDAGLNVIDTAECYGNSEELLGQTVAHRRKDYWLFTKVGHPTGSYVTEDYSAKSIAESIDRSLARMKTDLIDLVQLHSCSLDVLKKGEAIGALEKAKKQGKIRYVGYSGDSDAARWALESGKFDVLQTSVSIADQEVIERVLPLAREKNVGVIAKRPIANAAWRNGTKPAEAYHHTYWDRLQELNYEFLKGDLEKSIAIALRFTLSQPGVHTAIVGTTKPDRWKKNASLLDAGPLPAGEIEKIRARWKQVARPDWVGQT